MYPADHNQLCDDTLKKRSKRNGYVTSPKSEPRFERAYNRYGDSTWVRLNHFCNKGPVVDSARKGMPTLVASRRITCHTGLLLEPGVQFRPGVMGDRHTYARTSKTAIEDASNARCTGPWSFAE